MRSLKPPSSSRIPHQLNTAQLRRATQHMQQQCWLWGCDIRHSAGNLLIEYGFTRYRPHNQLDGSSVYVRTTATHTIMLWGFGVYVGDKAHGGTFIFRHIFDPIALMQPTCSMFTHDTVLKQACAPIPRHYDDIHTALQWFIAYEEWVVQHMGIDYRQQSIASWPKKSLQTEHAAFIDDWRQCALAVRQSLTIHPVSQPT